MAKSAPKSADGAGYLLDRRSIDRLSQTVRRLESQVVNLRVQLDTQRYSDYSRPSKEIIASFYLPQDDLENYIFPAEFLSRNTCYGYKVRYDKAGQNGLYNDDETHHTIANPVGCSWLMPGDTVLCWLNPNAKWNEDFSTEEAWEPFPGQGLMRPAKTYKDIPKGNFINGSQIWLTNPTGNQDILELTDISVSHIWCHSGVDIEATEDEPKELMLYYMSKNQTGYEFFVVARDCNT